MSLTGRPIRRKHRAIAIALETACVRALTFPRFDQRLTAIRNLKREADTESRIFPRFRYFRREYRDDRRR